MKIQRLSKPKKASKLSFAKRLSRSKAKITSKITESEKIEAQEFFEKNFIRDDYEYFITTLTKEDLPLIQHMKSSEVNSKNREKTSDNVKRLYRCLEAGEWYHESLDIFISTEGRLMNGQHTLEAINQYLLNANTPSDAEVQLGFKVGCDEDAMPYLDTQKRRSPEQNLKIKDVALNPTQKAVVLAEGKRLILGRPFGASGQVNYFEYMNVIENNKSILEDVFEDRVLSRDFPHKAIGYALFLLAKEDQQLAKEIMDEISDFHSDEDRGDSFADPSQLEEHRIVEVYRREKKKKMDAVNETSKTTRDCYRQEEFFPEAVSYLMENYNIDQEVFKV